MKEIARISVLESHVGSDVLDWLEDRYPGKTVKVPAGRVFQGDIPRAEAEEVMRWLSEKGISVEPRTVMTGARGGPSFYFIRTYTAAEIGRFPFVLVWTVDDYDPEWYRGEEMYRGGEDSPLILEEQAALRKLSMTQISDRLIVAENVIDRLATEKWEGLEWKRVKFMRAGSDWGSEIFDATEDGRSFYYLHSEIVLPPVAPSLAVIDMGTKEPVPREASPRVGFLFEPPYSIAEPRYDKSEFEAVGPFDAAMMYEFRSHVLANADNRPMIVSGRLYQALKSFNKTLRGSPVRFE